jgi:hypothetical protein
MVNSVVHVKTMAAAGLPLKLAGGLVVASILSLKPEAGQKLQPEF